MQAVILAAGASSRFPPFSQNTHKSMMSLCGKPLLAWTLHALGETGIQDVVVVCAPSDKKMHKFLATYRGLKVKKVLQKKPLGMGDALLSAKKYLKEEFLLIYGNQVDVGDFTRLIKKQGAPALLVDETDQPEKYGIIEIEGKRIKSIVEKPKRGTEPSKMRASGVYFLTKELVKILEKTPLEQYNFEKALDVYMKKARVGYVLSKTPVLQLKYPWDLFAIRDWLLEKLPEKKEKNVQISKTATIGGKVIMEDGARIFDYALVQGPVYIGRNAVVGAYSILRQGSVLEEKAEIQRFVDCTRSIIGPDSQIHTGFVGDSVLGSGIRIGAGLTVANRRVDRKNVEVEVGDKKVDTGRTYMGVLMGDDVKVGVNATFMPGVIVGEGSMVGPKSVVMDNVAANSLFYTDYKKVAVVKKLG